MKRIAIAAVAALSTALSAHAQSRSGADADAEMLTILGEAQRIGGLADASGPDVAEVKVDCLSSIAASSLCHRIEAKCSEIKEVNPKHGCGCTSNKNGPVSCETGVDP